jgi:hypothetical protein
VAIKILLGNCQLWSFFLAQVVGQFEMPHAKSLAPWGKRGA